MNVEGKPLKGRRGRVLSAALATALFAGPAGAVSLRMSARDALIDGSPGGDYKLEAQPPGLAVTDTGQEPVDVAMSLAPPTPRELKDGYEPLPAAWMKLLTARVALKPGESSPVAGWIRLPASTRAGPGQYQADCVADASAGGGETLRLAARVLVRVDDEDEIGRAEKKAPRGDAVVSVVTHQKDVAAPSLGKAVELREVNAALKVADLSDRPAWVAVRSVSAEEAPGKLPDGYEPSPNPRFLRPQRAVVELAGNSVVEAPLVLDIPDEPRYRGRRWVFAVSVTPLGRPGALPEYFKLFVTTRGETLRH